MKNYEVTFEIAKKIKNTDYLSLKLTEDRNAGWEEAIDMFDKRIKERFLDPIDVLIKNEDCLPSDQKKFGFVIMAIDFMLIETLQSFREGVTNSSGKSRDLFVSFLKKGNAFKEYFVDKFNPEEVYKDFRCGIIHQTQTFRNTKVWTIGDLIFKSDEFTIINRELFHEKVINEFYEYKENLINSSNIDLRKKFIVKMDYISGKDN